MKSANLKASRFPFPGVSLHFLSILALSLCQWAFLGRAADVRVGGAYARGSADEKTWSIGTDSVGLAFECRDGQFRLLSFQNKLMSPAREYVQAETASAPFALEPYSFIGRFVVETAWAKFLPNAATADPAAENLKLAVKKGDLIGFSVGPHGDFSGDETEWATTVDYQDGESYTSSKDATLDQGPIWFYYIQRPGTGWLELIDSVEMCAYAEENVRVPSAASTFRGPAITPHVGSTKFHPCPTFDAVRVWRAPRAGAVAIRGVAKHFKGGGDTDVRVLRIAARPPGYVPPPLDDRWALQSGSVHPVNAGGRPAVQLDLTLMRGALKAQFHVLAYPHTSVLRQWVELENTGTNPVTLKSPSSLMLGLRGDEAESLTHYWMIGGNSGPTHGLLQSAPLTASYHMSLDGQMTQNYTPWIALQRRAEPGDGAFVALEYLGSWQLAVDHEGPGPTTVTATLPELNLRELKAEDRLALPLMTLGVFRDNLDDMGVRLYNWQYEYLWDYTHHEWYGLMSWPVAWWPDSRNLHENFAGRLGSDIEFGDLMRGTGWEMLWDDAGWSESPNIWTPSREGPDFAQTLRYLDKTGMKWLVWFCGRPSAGIMDGKVGAWGNFQWRTDGVGSFDLPSDAAYREQITGFLKQHPRASFHTCNGGSTYSHTFEIQRYTDVNYFSDGGRGEQSNYYFSYLDTPDKWLDVITAFSKGPRVYDRDTAREILTMVPTWDMHATPEGQEELRLIGEIYHYLTQEGVAGRWSYAFHPGVKGDLEHHYFQRTSWDRERACIILKHRATNDVTVYPRGLLSEHRYTVGFDSQPSIVTRTGADLMANGIVIRNQVAGELIYLGLPQRPRGGSDRTAPVAPGRVLSRRETNVGHTGVGIYWSPGWDENWIRYYEVRRGADVIGKVAWGTYYFDHAAGWNPRLVYSVRTVDGDGNPSAWAAASAYADQAFTVSALGGHFPELGREGWRAETTSDGHTFTPMTWVPPARYSSGDTGGTANQPGGAEGYWEGAGTARVGRGWQQASTNAQCVRTWVATQAGTVRIVGRAMKEYYRRKDGGPLRVRIQLNEQMVWPAEGWAMVRVADLTGESHDFTTSVKAGDALRFVLDQGTTPESDVIGWMPNLVYVDDAVALPEAGVVRIRCGADAPFVDAAGIEWSADRYYQGGRSRATAVPIAGALPTAADQALYQAGRTGTDFSYAIPVPAGLYALRLKFAETELEWFFERPMNLDINGRRVLRNFDVCQAARGPRRAYEQVFRYLVPDGAGRLTLRFSGGWEPLAQTAEAMVQAIEVLPESKPVVRIDAGSTRQFIDWNSFVWEADRAYEGGRVLRSEAAVSQASPTLYDQELYRTARTGRSFGYRIAVSAGLYVVHLKFAELWLKEPGQRPMNIEINGRRFRGGWDPANAAGQVGMAADIRAEDITPDRQGLITVRISAAGAQDAILQGIEIE